MSSIKPAPGAKKAGDPGLEGITSWLRVWALKSAQCSNMVLKLGLYLHMLQEQINLEISMGEHTVSIFIFYVKSRLIMALFHLQCLKNSGSSQIETLLSQHAASKFAKKREKVSIKLTHWLFNALASMCHPSFLKQTIYLAVLGLIAALRIFDLH